MLLASSFSKQAILRTKMGNSQGRQAVRTLGSKVDTIKQTVSSHPVVVYSKTYCPYCTKAKSLLTDLNVSFELYELDKMGDGAELQSSLTSITGSRTVPQVFIGGNFIGGCDDTVAAQRSGKLAGYLKDAGVTIG